MNIVLRTIRDYLDYMTTIRLPDVVDILVIAFVIYHLVGLVRRTGSYKVARGIIIFVILTWLSGLLKMNVTNFLLGRALELGLLAVVILFQPELRRLLGKFGSSRMTFLFDDAERNRIEGMITQTVLACKEMSRHHTGALIVFERDNPLDDQIGTGTIIGSEITAELLKNIFFPMAPLHDGAIIVREGRIAAAGCMLPLSTNANLSRELGMRHRAGIGMSERSDAVVVIISEETGSISVAVDGMLKRHLSTDTFEQLLQNELATDEDESQGWFKNAFKVKKNGKR